MIIVKVDAMLDNYALKNLSEAIKEMADTGAIVLDKSMEIVDINEADELRLESPEKIIPPGFKIKPD